jgi:hypothetical protein
VQVEGRPVRVRLESVVHPAQVHRAQVLRAQSQGLPVRVEGRLVRVRRALVVHPVLVRLVLVHLVPPDRRADRMKNS